MYAFALGQPISLDIPQIEEQVRRAQLLGRIESDLSFNVRPVQPRKISSWNASLDSLGNTPLLGKGVKFLGNFGYLNLTPLQAHQQYVTRHPFLGNDGPMIPASGYQNMLSGGFILKLGPLAIQAKPQWVYAKNDLFQGFPTVHDPAVWDAMVGIWNYTDIPERFGNADFKKFHYGNTSVRLNLGPVSAGISNENIWWGPTINNALIMSSHAPGFLHATIDTRKPWRTPIGSFEFQLVGGMLNNSGFDYPLRGDVRYVAEKPLEDRYLNAGILSYQPKFLKGVSAGAMRSVQVYKSSLERTKIYFPILDNIDRKKDIFDIEKDRDQQAAFFVRWLMQKAKAELYVEWGRNDAFFTWRDFIQQPEHSRGYTLGFRKMIKHKKIGYWELLSETTRLQQPSTWPPRDAYTWYRHVPVLHGMTHQGETIGAYIGPGSNISMLRLTRIIGLNQFGIQLERTTQNGDFYEHNYGLPGVKKWTDYGLSVFGQYQWKNFILNSRLFAKKSYNYQWYQPEGARGRGLNDPFDISSYMGQLGITFVL